jgi:hypothetical protein
MDVTRDEAKFAHEGAAEALEDIHREAARKTEMR